MKYSVKWLKDQLNSGNEFTYIGFWGNKDDTLQEKTFSNFYKTKFTTKIYTGEDYTFDCSEQYFMYLKALEFRDYDILPKILSSNLKSKEYKDLGRQVKNYDDSVWSVKRYNYMKQALFLKFTQNKKLKEYLLNTNDAILIETSPFDSIFGIKMSKVNGNYPYKENDWKNVNKWKGENLLGFALMEIRDDLKKS